MIRKPKVTEIERTISSEASTSTGRCDSDEIIPQNLPTILEHTSSEESESTAELPNQEYRDRSPQVSILKVRLC